MRFSRLYACVLGCIVSALVFAGAAAAATNAVVRGGTVLDFQGSVRTGLEHSPRLKRSSIEVGIRRLGQADMKWDYVPSVFVNVSYLVTRPASADSPMSISASTGPYDPIKPYFTIQAAEEFTRIAVLVHLQEMAEGIHEIGKIFLQLDAAERGMAVQDEVVRLAEQNRTMWEKMKGSAGDSLIDRQIAEKELEESQIVRERLRMASSALSENLLTFLGVSPGSQVTIVASNAIEQVIGRFEPAKATLLEARDHSTEIQVQEIQKKLQELSILAAYAKYIPSPVISLRTADPLDSSSNDSGLYLAVGLDIHVWDGFDRRRDVRRQKEILRQFELDYDKAANALSTTWKSAQDSHRIASLDLKASEAQLEIARLRAERDRISHESATLPVHQLQEGRLRHLQARQYAIAKALDCNLSILYLRHLSGNLRDSYVDSRALSAELLEGRTAGSDR